jgi:hypothetical protein
VTRVGCAGGRGGSTEQGETERGGGKKLPPKLWGPDIAVAAYALLGHTAEGGIPLWVGEENELPTCPRGRGTYIARHAGGGGHWRLARWEGGHWEIVDTLEQPLGMDEGCIAKRVVTTGCQKPPDDATCGYRALYLAARKDAGRRLGRVPEEWATVTGPSLVEFAKGVGRGRRVRINWATSQWEVTGETAPPEHADWLAQMAAAKWEAAAHAPAAAPQAPTRAAADGARKGAARAAAARGGTGSAKSAAESRAGQPRASRAILAALADADQGSPTQAQPQAQRRAAKARAHDPRSEAAQERMAAVGEGSSEQQPSAV